LTEAEKEKRLCPKCGCEMNEASPKPVSMSVTYKVTLDATGSYRKETSLGPFTVWECEACGFVEFYTVKPHG